MDITKHSGHKNVLNQTQKMLFHCVKVYDAFLYFHTFTFKLSIFVFITNGINNGSIYLFIDTEIRVYIRQDIQY